MKKITDEELKQILEEHALWIESNHKEGKCADLSGFDLSNRDFRGANLKYANLSHANLNHVDLSHANLSHVYLRHADLTGANLNGTYLTHTNLRHVKLTCAFLRDADLSSADLSHSDLSSADLKYANLKYAGLDHADLSHADLTNTCLDSVVWRKINKTPNAETLNAIKEIESMSDEEKTKFKTSEELFKALDDSVNHPKHYTQRNIECIDVAETFNFNLGNAMKYIWRCEDKGKKIEDLQKAVWYLNREIERSK